LADLPLVIAGGGIGGLTTALACAAGNIPTEILERDHGPADAGAGIQVPPNAGRILDELGLETEIAAASALPDAIRVSNRRGRTLASMPLGRPFHDRYGAAYRTIHRADLLRILRDAVATEPSANISDSRSVIRFAASTEQVNITVDTGAGREEIIAAGLIGADGVGSVVRAAIGGSSEAANTGFDAWRAVLPRADWPVELPGNDVGLWLGPGRHVVHYPVRGGSAINVAIIAPAGEADIAAVARGLAGWSRAIRVLIETAAEWHRWPIRTVSPSYRRPGAIPVALVGDAAHAMAPFLAQGGAMAVEDAAIIARCIGASRRDLAAAFARYREERYRRVTRIHRAASRTGSIYHLPSIAGFARDVAIRLLGEALQRRYDWIYRRP
jgi:salicylate hydroxylase